MHLKLTFKEDKKKIKILFIHFSQKQGRKLPYVHDCHFWDEEFSFEFT